MCWLTLTVYRFNSSRPTQAQYISTSFSAGSSLTAIRQGVLTAIRQHVLTAMRQDALTAIRQGARVPSNDVFGQEANGTSL